LPKEIQQLLLGNDPPAADLVDSEPSYLDYLTAGSDVIRAPTADPPFMAIEGFGDGSDNDDFPWYG
jgi:hypothetical protein